MNLLALASVEPPIRVEHTDGDEALSVRGRVMLAVQAFGYLFGYIYVLAAGGITVSDGMFGVPYGVWAGGMAGNLWARAKGAS